MGKKYMLSRENALKAVTKAVNDIYDNSPSWFRLTIQGGVDELPTMKVIYDHHVYDAAVEGYKEVKEE